MKKIMAATLVGIGIVIFCALAQANILDWFRNQNSQKQTQNDSKIMVAYDGCSLITDCYQKCNCEEKICKEKCGNDEECQAYCVKEWDSCSKGCEEKP
jgi:hypothetical protein